MTRTGRMAHMDERTEALRAYLAHKGFNPDRLGNWDRATWIGLAEDAFLAGWAAAHTPTADGRVRLDYLLGVYSVGSGDWPWTEEYDNLINQPDTQRLLARIREEGIREPILLGTDGRIWDGHHRIIIAMHLGIDSVPVEFAGGGRGAQHAAENNEREEGADGDGLEV